MRTAVLVLLLASSTADARPASYSIVNRFVMRTETEPTFGWWQPSGADVRIRLADHVSLLFGFDGFKTPILKTEWRPPFRIPAQARRTMIAFHAGAMVHIGDYLYALAGVGETAEQLKTQSADFEWLDEGDRWRPHAFVGSGVEYRHGPVGVGLELRANALGGSGPTTTSSPLMETPDPLSRYALQASIGLVVYGP